MNKIVMTAFFAASLSGAAFAASATDSEAIYNSLNVTETGAQAGYSAVFTKSVGGLTCSMTQKTDPTQPGVSSKASYDCMLDPAQIDAAAIYDAMSVSETKLKGTDEPAYKKEVGGLSCRKYQSARDSYSYRCNLVP